VIAVLLAAVCIFVFVYAENLGWGFLCLIAIAICAFLMVYFKKKQEKKEGTDNPPPPEGDFITGRVTAEKPSDRYTAFNSAITVEQTDGTIRTFILTRGDKDTFDKVGTKSPLGEAVWHKQIGDEITYTDADLKEVTVKIINIE
ncbi:MAG: GreA/GreB family elongation factor, partial [Clostridia bacterium]|nr:GreA/GreB family elongation factor [Clostridia bacterium]